MPLLTRTILKDLGIHLADQDYQSLAKHFEETLDERVIEEIVSGLSPEQAQQLVTLRQSGDQEVLAWLQQTVPELSEIVADEVDILLGELAENSEAIS